MADNRLIDILRPAFEPCPNFETACKDYCRWIPKEGHVPRAFGGATRRIEDVRLILVTAEPGDPADGEKYSGSPDKMLHHSMSMQNTFLEEGGLHHGGRGTQFHKNMRYILDRCWPDEPIRDQLRKTWITPSVLCSAEVSGGEVPEDIEDTCVSTYLIHQINLLKNTFVVALGEKAQRRLKRKGVRNDFDAYHPAAWATPRREETWEEAADAFRSSLEGNDGLTIPEPAPTGSAEKMKTVKKEVAAAHANIATALTALKKAEKEVAAAHANVATALKALKAAGGKTPRGGGGRLFSDGAVITLMLTDEAEIDRMRRPGTNGRRFWEIYRNGMTVGEALKRVLSI